MPPFTRVISKQLPQTMSNEYATAIDTLNTLISNPAVIKKTEQILAEKQTTFHDVNRKKLDTFRRSGLTFEDLGRLSVIHVAGTKGKGTTCAVVESILRHHGFRTGFYSSPHLVQVRERIRIDGRPLDKSSFTEHFWKVYNNLHGHDEMPGYFHFLTLMALHVFLANRVDVAVIEAGIGGEYDFTNIFRHVPVVGITSLGIDHVGQLGHTLDSIAWHKAGIMKEGAIAFTAPQPTLAMDVLKQRSAEKHCKLNVVDDVLDINVQPRHMPTKIFNINMNLAIALSKTWIELEGNGNIDLELTKKAIENYSWPGRFQIIPWKNLTFYLDGAHTIESITICTDWFMNEIQSSTIPSVLIFNLTHKRKARDFFEIIQKHRFDLIIFVPNFAEYSNDNIMIEDQYSKCLEHQEIWLSMDDHQNDDVKVFKSLLDVFSHLESNGNRWNILITGSLHLIGTTLSVLDPTLNGSL